MKPLWCSYCRAPAVVWLTYRRAAGGRTFVHVAACEKHEGCKHWARVLAQQPTAEIERRTVP